MDKVVPPLKRRCDLKEGIEDRRLRIQQTHGSFSIKHRLMGQGSAYVTFFEDNHLAALLGRPEDVLASELGEPEAECLERLRKLAYTSFGRRSRQTQYPQLPMFHAYQEAVVSKGFAVNEKQRWSERHVTVASPDISSTYC